MIAIFRQYIFKLFIKLKKQMIYLEMSIGYIFKKCTIVFGILQHGLKY